MELFKDSTPLKCTVRSGQHVDCASSSPTNTNKVKRIFQAFLWAYWLCISPILPCIDSLFGMYIGVMITVLYKLAERISCESSVVMKGALGGSYVNTFWCPVLAIITNVFSPSISSWDFPNFCIGIWWIKQIPTYKMYLMKLYVFAQLTNSFCGLLDCRKWKTP